MKIKLNSISSFNRDSLLKLLSFLLISALMSTSGYVAGYKSAHTHGHYDIPMKQDMMTKKEEELSKLSTERQQVLEKAGSHSFKDDPEGFFRHVSQALGLTRKIVETRTRK